MGIKKQVKSKKEPHIEVVGLHKDLINILKENKTNTGISVRFYVENTVKKQMIEDKLLEADWVSVKD